MIKIKACARRHPVGIYFVFAFAISWIGVLLIGGPIFMRGESVKPKDLWLMGPAVLAGPCLSGLAMSCLVDGRPGVLFSREDITGALVGCASATCDGYEPDSAFRIMRNIVRMAAK